MCAINVLYVMLCCFVDLEQCMVMYTPNSLLYHYVTMTSLLLTFQGNKLMVNFRGVYSVMKEDQKITTHPVYIPVQHPHEISEIFDLISYAKVSIALHYIVLFYYRILL